MTRVLSSVVAAVVAAAGLLIPAVPADAAASYAVSRALDPGSGRAVVVRWSPCQVIAGHTTTHVITYRVNTGGQPGRVTLVQQALRRVTDVSGLRFRYLGTTRYVPHNAVLHYASGPRAIFDAAQERAITGAELVVAWAAKSRTNLLSGTEAGVGTVSWSASRVSQLRIVQASVVMRTGVRLEPGFRAGTSVGTLLLHELGHAMGLDHVTSRSQVMYPIVGSWSPAGYAACDRAGLRAVGRPAGCLHTVASAPADPRLIARLAGVTVSG